MGKYKSEFDDNDSLFSRLDNLLGADDGFGGRRRNMGLIPGLLLAGIALGVLSGVVWVGIQGGGDDAANAPLPVVRADAGSYRTAPDAPGGMEIPHRDSTVFETLASGPLKSNKVENLLEEPQDPQPRSAFFEEDESQDDKGIEDQSAQMPDNETLAEAEVPPQPNAITKDGDEDNAELSDPSSDQIASLIESIPSPEAKVKAANVNENSMKKTELNSIKLPEPGSMIERGPKPGEPIAFDKPVSKSKPAPKAETQTVVSKTTAQAANGVEPAAGPASFYVQLASLRSEADARKAWDGFTKKFPDLKATSLDVQKADLGERGTFYRVRGGPVTKAEAKALCDLVTSQSKGGCLVSK